MSSPILGRRALAQGMAIPAGMGLCLLLSACGSTNATTAHAAPAAAANTGAGAGHVPNGVSGQILSVAGQVLQVQGPTGQTAVNWTDATTLAQVLPAAESDVAVGKCVQVRPADPSAPADLTQPVPAGAVVLSDPVDGTCLRMGGGGGARTGAARMGSGVRGTVASISGDTMTVTPMARPGSAADPTPRTVTLSSSTAYSRIGSAGSADLAVGKCVSAFGTPDNGGIDAKTLILRPGGAPCTGASSGASSTPSAGTDSSGTTGAAPSDSSSETSNPASSGDSAGSGSSAGS